MKLLKTWGDSAEGPCIDRVTCSLIPCSKPIPGKRKFASYHLFLSRNFTKLSFKFVEDCDVDLKVSYFYLWKGPSHKNNPTKRTKTTSTATSKMHTKNQHWVSIYKWFTFWSFKHYPERLRPPLIIKGVYVFEEWDNKYHVALFVIQSFYLLCVPLVQSFSFSQVFKGSRPPASSLTIEGAISSHWRRKSSTVLYCEQKHWLEK